MFYYDGDKTLSVWNAENSSLNLTWLKSFFRILIGSFEVQARQLNVKLNLFKINVCILYL